MPKDPIIPGEDKGWEFEEKGYQERNLENLLNLLKKEEYTELLQTLAETDKKTWSLINVSIMDLKNFVLGGGISTLKSDIREQFANLKNLMWENLYADFIPLIMELYEIAYPVIQALIPVVQWLSEVLRPLIDGIVDGMEKMLGLHKWTKEEINEMKKRDIEFREYMRKIYELQYRNGIITLEMYNNMIIILGLLDPWKGTSEAPPKFGREWMFQEPGLPTKY